jgi:hypothetical protein
MEVATDYRTINGEIAKRKIHSTSGFCKTRKINWWKVLQMKR